MTTSCEEFLILSTTSLNNFGSLEPFPLIGSLTCICTEVAPAFADSIASSAISLAETGTLSLLPTVSPAPVTAQVRTTSKFIFSPPI